MSELNMNELEQVTGGKGSKHVVKAKGDVRVRKGPGLDHAEIGMIKSGSSLPFLGETKVDNRGVGWYKVSCNGKTGWVSSKYAMVI